MNGLDLDSFRLLSRVVVVVENFSRMMIMMMITMHDFSMLGLHQLLEFSLDKTAASISLAMEMTMHMMPVDGLVDETVNGTFGNIDPSWYQQHRRRSYFQ